MSADDPMEVEAVLDGLRRALVLQQRSAVQFTLAAGGLGGLALQGLVERLSSWAKAELDDARLLVTKIVALGGDPPAEVGPLRWPATPEEHLDWLIESEDEAIAACHEVIPHTGQQPESEALEHLLEHLIMRKQAQVDVLRVARGAPSAPTG